MPYQAMLPARSGHRNSEVPGFATHRAIHKGLRDLHGSQSHERDAGKTGRAEPLVLLAADLQLSRRTAGR